MALLGSENGISLPYIEATLCSNMRQLANQPALKPREPTNMRRSNQSQGRCTKREKGKVGTAETSRFCVECGIKAQPSSGGYYPPGSRITIRGTTHILCITYGKLGLPAQKDNLRTHCEMCYRQNLEQERKRDEKIAGMTASWKLRVGNVAKSEGSDLIERGTGFEGNI